MIYGSESVLIQKTRKIEYFVWINFSRRIKQLCKIMWEFIPFVIKNEEIIFYKIWFYTAKQNNPYFYILEKLDKCFGKIEIDFVKLRSLLPLFYFFIMFGECLKNIAKINIFIFWKTITFCDIYIIHFFLFHIFIYFENPVFVRKRQTDILTFLAKKNLNYTYFHQNLFSTL